MDPSASTHLPHDDQSKTILVSTWTLTGLSLIFLALRLYCKFRTRRGLWWDDYVMVLSWLCLTASVVTGAFAVTKGNGKHVWDVPPENFALLGLIGNFTGTFSILAAVWSKTAFALTLLRLMSGKMKVVLWFIIVSMNVAMGLNALFLWIRCWPVEKTWRPMMPGSCWAAQVYPTYGCFAAGYSALMDFVLAFLPWKIVWNLQMKKKEKFGVATAMSLGVVAGAIAVVKTVEIPTLAMGDFTFAATPLIVWGAAESAVTIMAASIPVLRVLLRDASNMSKKYQLSTENTDSSRMLRTKASHRDIAIISMERSRADGLKSSSYSR